MVERCEWNPTEGRWSYAGDDGCQNEATWIVGRDGLGHVCYECSQHSRFRRMKRTPMQLKRMRGEPFEMLNGDEQRQG